MEIKDWVGAASGLGSLAVAVAVYRATTAQMNWTRLVEDQKLRLALLESRKTALDLVRTVIGEFFGAGAFRGEDIARLIDALRIAELVFEDEEEALLSRLIIDAQRWQAWGREQDRYREPAGRGKEPEQSRFQAAVERQSALEISIVENLRPIVLQLVEATRVRTVRHKDKLRDRVARRLASQQAIRRDAPAPSPREKPVLQVVIDGQTYDRAKVLEWEARRMSSVRRKMKLPTSVAPLEEQRRELADHKLWLGHDAIRKIISPGLWMSEKVSRISVALSGKSRRFSVCEIIVSEGSAKRFARWFDELTLHNNERDMIAACPDHYIISRDAAGRQLVIETTGGSPLPAEFTVDYSDVASLHVQPDPSYSHQVAGVARLADGLIIGGVRHQFRQEDAGFRALLTVEFPGRVPKRMIAAHRWHLAAEFCNWIEAAHRQGE